MPCTSSTGTPSGGPATRTRWVMPFAVTVRCAISIRGMLPRRRPPVHGPAAHDPARPDVPRPARRP
ncbi:hypothetical protein, partial [Micromonospora sp. 4G55]|uniref:hypothetical protein n=1 Tax=Micromonospora sp. 4G55 TaxID=2806102 RepID=UPI001EE44C4E